MRARLATLLLQASGHVGALGPVLAAATARAAEALADAALWASPLAECPGCGAAVPALTLAGVEVCGGCQEREDAAPAPPVEPAAHWHPRVNVTAYHHRAAKPEEPS